MYGYTPRAATLRDDSAPPENRSKKPASWLVSKTRWSAATSAPGTGMCAMNRNATSIANVKTSFRRRSGILKASSAALRSGAFSMGLLAYQFGGTARGFDLLTCGRAELVGADGQFYRQIALAEDFYRSATAAQHTGSVKLLGPHGAATWKVA